MERRARTDKERLARGELSREVLAGDQQGETILETAKRLGSPKGSVACARSRLAKKGLLRPRLRGRPSKSALGLE